MRSTLKLFLLSLIVIPGLTLVGCGGGSPTSPSGGATIVGTVNPFSAASSFSVNGTSAASSSGGGIIVSVMGTNLSATTDSSGNFVLAGVPEGAVTLRFQGSGVDATLKISGLVAGQTLTITVRVSGSTATLGAPLSPGSSPSPSPTPSPGPVQQQCPAMGQKAEIEGLITGTGTSSITVFQEGDVKGSYVCQVPPGTPIHKGNKTFTPNQLQLGWRVHVSGSGLGSSGGVCQVRANDIKVQ